MRELSFYLSPPYEAEGRGGSSDFVDLATIQFTNVQLAQLFDYQLSLRCFPSSGIINAECCSFLVKREVQCSNVFEAQSSQTIGSHSI